MQKRIAVYKREGRGNGPFEAAVLKKCSLG
jgi:hypothetical protein